MSAPFTEVYLEDDSCAFTSLLSPGDRGHIALLKSQQCNDEWVSGNTAHGRAYLTSTSEELFQSGTMHLQGSVVSVAPSWTSTVDMRCLYIPTTLGSTAPGNASCASLLAKLMGNLVQGPGKRSKYLTHQSRRKISWHGTFSRAGLQHFNDSRSGHLSGQLSADLRRPLLTLKE